MSNRCPALAVLALAAPVALAAMAGAECRAADSPWAGEPFAGDPAAIIEAARAIAPPPGAAAQILFKSTLVEFDETGRRHEVFRTVYRILSPGGVSSLDQFSAYWAPWCDQRPLLDARVILPGVPGGSVHRLDPATLDDAPVADEEQDALSDRRVIRAPLPAVGVGAIIETMVETREERPSFDAGSVVRLRIGAGFPLLDQILIVDYPQDLPVRTVLNPADAARSSRSEAGGRVRLTFTAGPLEPLEEPPDLLPPETAAYPYLGVGHGESWNSVATRYHAIVEERIANSDLETLSRETVGDAATTQEKAARLMSLVRERTRYTGLEFGEAALIPQPPRETLKRGYGDCKDRATLLVALLRAAGLDARIALLDAGVEADVDRDLPGLGQFDHAIVMIAAEPPVWIDATLDWARPGQLPAADQGRLALIAHPSTAGLVLTPVLPPEQNAQIEQREVFLAEFGPSRVVETTRPTGSSESFYRQNYHVQEAEDTRKVLQNYVRDAYGAKDLGESSFTPPGKFDEPFQLRIEAVEARRGMTDFTTAAVAVTPVVLFERLPGLLTEETPKEPKKDDDVPPEPPRTADFVIEAPLLSEYHYRINPPPGFIVDSLPEPAEESAGPVTYSASFTSREDSRVEATVRLNVASRRFTPAEAEQLRELVARLKAQGPQLILFKSRASARLSEGNVALALTEHRQLAALHPEEALHRSQLAMTLLEAGLGEAARREAREAVRLEPGSAVAQRVLGMVLSRDLFGRSLKDGFDRDGAVAAYRKAREIEPDDADSRGQIAILLEHDSHAGRYAPGARVEEAIEEYRSRRKDLDVDDLDRNLLILLARAGRFDEMEREAAGMKSIGERDSLRLVALAGRSGAEAVIREAKKISDPANRRGTLEATGRFLIVLRRYPDAALLLAEAAGGAPDPLPLRQLVDILKSTKRFEDILLPPDAPGTPLLRIMVLVLGEPAGQLTKKVKALISPLVTTDSPAPEAGLEDMQTTLGRTLSSAGLPKDVMLDLLISHYEVSAEGTGRIRRTRMSNSWLGDTQATKGLVERQADGRFLVADFGGDAKGHGAVALALLEAGDRESAVQVLDWARRDMTAPGDDDPLAEPWFARLYTTGATVEPDALRRAATVLAIGELEPARALRKIRELREGDVPESQRPILDMAFALLLARTNDPAAAAEARKVLDAFPGSETALGVLATILQESGRPDEIKAIVGKKLEQRGTDLNLLRFMMSAEMDLGNFDASAAIGRRLADLGQAKAPDLNNLAWVLFAGGHADDEALSLARRAATLEKNSSHASLNTLAAILARSGRVLEAREALHKSIEESPEAGDAEWFIVGNIAEQCGEPEAAAAAFKRIEPPKGGRRSAVSVYALSRRPAGADVPLR